MGPSEMIRRIEAVENAGIAAAAIPLMTEDVVFMVPTAPVLCGRDTVVEFIGRNFGWLLERYERRIGYVSDEVRECGDVAFDRGRFTFTCTPKEGGVPEVNSGKYLFVYERDRAGSWRISRAIQSLDEIGDDEG
jgi:ketosteroid isomerase-like protein